MRWLWLIGLCTGATIAAPPAAARAAALDRDVMAGARVTIDAPVAGAERCALRVGARTVSARVRGAERVAFSFRPRRGPLRMALTCGAAKLTGVVRVRSSRRTGAALAGSIAVRVVQPPPAPPAAAPSAPPSPWLSPAAALARAQSDWAQFGATYLSAFRNGQCTDWAAQRRPDIVEHATVRLWAAYLTGATDAIANWNGGFWDDTARAAGLEVGTVPRAGAIVTFDPGTLGTGAAGHIAYVESVAGDGAFTVSEMNAPRPYEVTYRTIDTATVARGGIAFVY